MAGPERQGARRVIAAGESRAGQGGKKEWKTGRGVIRLDLRGTQEVVSQ